MSLYLYQNNQQTGPFSEEQVRQMFQAGIVTAATLGWKEGLVDWSPVSSLLPPLSPENASPPPPPKPQRSPLGIISFAFSLVSVVCWIILLGMAGIAHNNGTATRTFNMIIGFFFMAGVGLNFVAMVFGIIGAFKGKANTLAIVGACLNGFVIVALVALVIIGLVAKGAH